MADPRAVYDGPAERDAPLADKSNFRLGGRADWLFTPESHEQVGAVLSWIRDEGLDLTVLGMTNCTLYTSVEVAIPLLNVGGSAAWTIPVPPSWTLVGASFLQQGLVLDPNANPAGIVFSNAAVGVVGSR